MISLRFSCTVPGTPVPQGRVRIPRWGKPYYPARSKAHRALLVAAFSIAWKQPALEGPVRVRVEVYGAPANSDLDNHAKQVMDALQEAGVIKSDDIRVVRYLAVEAYPAKKKDRKTYVEVSEWT